MNHPNDRDYLSEQQEYQQQQYNPGHYTGGRIPPWLSKPGNAKRLGIALLALGGFFDVWIIYSALQIRTAENPTDTMLSIIYIGIFGIIFSVAGVMMLRR